jgi:hypothetical protein
MSKTWTRTANGKARRKRASAPPFVMLPKYMVRSAAWRSLSGEAVAAFIEISNRYDGCNNGRLHLSDRELAAVRPISRVTAYRAKTELKEKGFVEVVRASGFNIKDRKRQAEELRLTTFHCDVTREPPSKTFMKWVPGEPQSKIISRLHIRATTASQVKPCRKNIEEFASTAPQVKP